jgi:hypothetical protein
MTRAPRPRPEPHTRPIDADRRSGATPAAPRSRRAYAAMLAAGVVLAVPTAVIPGGVHDAAGGAFIVLAIALGALATHRLYGRSLRSRVQRSGVEALLVCAAAVGVSTLLARIVLALILGGAGAAGSLLS